MKITGIGSVPYKDPFDVCLRIIKVCQDMPFWPQLPKLNRLEGMLNQFVEGLDFIEETPSGGLKLVDQKDRAERLTSFYEKAMGSDLSAFGISEQRARGLYVLTDLLTKHASSGEGLFIKGQVVGPFTLAVSVKDTEGRNALSDQEIWAAILEGIKKKALWQANMLKRTGRRPVIFFDEPSLSGYGSAFSNISQEKIVGSLGWLTAEMKKEEEVLIGIHCCGNTDWGLLLKTGVDIISFDSFGFSNSFFLYGDEIRSFLEANKMIAWGYVPTSPEVISISLEVVAQRLRECLERVVALGFDFQTVLDRSIFTPSCGMGSLGDAGADRVFEILSITDKLLKR